VVEHGHYRGRPHHVPASKRDAVDHHTDDGAAGRQEWASRTAWLAARRGKDEEELFETVALTRRTLVGVHCADERNVTAGAPIAHGRPVADTEQSTRNARTVARHERRPTRSVTGHLQNGQVDLRVLEEDARRQGEALAEQELDRLCDRRAGDDVPGGDDPVGLQQRKAGPAAPRRPDGTKGKLVPRDVLVRVIPPTLPRSAPGPLGSEGRSPASCRLPSPSRPRVPTAPAAPEADHGSSS